MSSCHSPLYVCLYIGYIEQGSNAMETPLTAVSPVLVVLTSNLASLKFNGLGNQYLEVWLGWGLINDGCGTWSMKLG